MYHLLIPCRDLSRAELNELGVPGNAGKGKIKKFIQDWAENRVRGASSSQFQAFSSGLYQVVGKEALEVFKGFPNELDLLISGEREIDVSDWQKHTLYDPPLIHRKDQELVEWFWEYVEKLDQSDRARLLKFATGSPGTPAGGFAYLWASGNEKWFEIQTQGQGNRLPTAHTCFNLLILPRYASKEELSAKFSSLLDLDQSTFDFK